MTSKRRCDVGTGEYALFVSLDGKRAWCGKHVPIRGEEFRLITGRRSPVWEYKCVHDVRMTATCDDCEGVSA